MADREKTGGIKRIVRWIMMALGGLVLLYVVMLVIWFFSFSSDKVATQFGKFAEEELDAKLSIEKTSLDIFPAPSIHLQGVQLAPRQGLPLNAEELSIALEFIPALWGEARPAAITITHAQLPIMEDAQGRLALGGFLPNYGSGKHFAYHGHIYIKQSSLGYFPPNGVGRITVESADYDGEVELGDDGGLALDGGIKLKNITRYGSDPYKALFEGLDIGFNGGIQIAGDGSGWEIEHGKVWLSGAELDITASGKRSTDGGTKATWHLTGDDVYLAELSATLPDAVLPAKTDLNLGGKIALDLECEAMGERSALNGYIEVKDGECALKGEREGISQINGRVNFSGTAVEFAGIHGTTAGSQIALDGKLTDIAHPNWDVSLKGKIPLGIVARLFGMASEWRVSGLGSIDARMAGSIYDTANLRLSGSLSPDNVILYTPYLGAPFTGISGEIKLYDSSLTAGLVAKLGDGNLTLSGSMTGWANPALDVKVTGDAVDLDKALEKVPKGIKSAQTAQKSPSIKCDIALQRCKLFGIQTENVQFTSDYANSVLQIRQLTVGGYGGSMVLSGQVDLSGQIPSYTVMVDLSNIDINKYLSDETDVKDCVLGRLDAHCMLTANGTDAPGVKKTLAANGTASLKSGHIKELAPLIKLAEWSGLAIYRDLPVESVKVDFSISDGKITLKDVQETSRDIDMRLAGTIGLDLVLDLKVQNNFSLQYSQNTFGTNKPTKMVRDIKGRGVLAFFATGGSKDPDFRLDPKAMGQEVINADTGNVGQAIKDGQKSPPSKPQSPENDGILPRKWF